MPIAKEPFESIGDTLLNSFLQTKKSEFEAFQAKAEEEGRVAGRFRQLKEKIETEQAILPAFIELMDIAKNTNFAFSLYACAKNDANGILTVERHCTELFNIYLLHVLEPDLRKLALADLKKSEAELANFLSDNDAILRRLKLV